MIAIATYNVLADAYIRREYYPRTEPALLRAGARDDALVARIRSFDADVVCLQEVEQRLMDKLGLQGRFVHKAGGKPDGCATLVRGEAEHEAMHFDDGSGHLALLTMLPNATIANTHLKWDPPGPSRWGIEQAKAILRALAARPRPWIVCGDFNAEPDSEVLRVFRDFEDAHPSSVATCNSNGRAKKIDYILVTSELACEPLPAALVDNDTSLPSSLEPSDHVALRAILR